MTRTQDSYLSEPVKHWSTTLSNRRQHWQHLTLSSQSDKFGLQGGGILRRLVYKHSVMHIPNIQTPSPPTSPPPDFCFGRGILWCSASGTRAVKHCSNIWAQTRPSWLSSERGVPSALIGCLCRAWAFGRRLHWASLVPRSISCAVGLKTDRPGLRGRQPHVRRLRFPHHQRPCLARPVLSWDAVWHRSKSSGQQVS